MLLYIYLFQKHKSFHQNYANINPLNTKRRQFYLKTQYVPRSKHIVSVIKTNQFML